MYVVYHTGNIYQDVEISLPDVAPRKQDIYVHQMRACGKQDKILVPWGEGVNATPVDPTWKFHASSLPIQSTHTNAKKIIESASV